MNKSASLNLASADSLNLLAANQTTNARKQETLLAIVNPDGSLPGASQKVNTLGQIFNRAQVFTENQATINHVVQISKDGVPFVHFATHGIINSSDPKESFLLLAGEQNRLSVRDLVENKYHISFDGTRLVTLSACNTNIGGWEPDARTAKEFRSRSQAPRRLPQRCARIIKTRFRRIQIYTQRCV